MFKELTYSVDITLENGEKNKRNILNNISGIFRSGEVAAIMGTSGSGKTTLLNILAHRISHFEGKILANDL